MQILLSPLSTVCSSCTACFAKSQNILIAGSPLETSTGKSVASSFVPQGGLQGADEATETSGTVPQSSQLTAAEQVGESTDPTDTAQYTFTGSSSDESPDEDNTASQQAQAESQLHKQQFNPHLQDTPAVTDAAAPLADVHTNANAPAPGPVSLAARHIAAAVPAPAPSNVR